MTGDEDPESERKLHAQVCIAGGGPAGMVLGLLLARAGVRVIVLEKHEDFLRDFRGDTIHPTTLDLLDDLGIRESLATVPHSEVATLDTVVDGVRFRTADFRTVGRSGRLWFMPQWDLLDALATAARHEPTFTLLMSTTATGLLTEHRTVVGVTAEAPDGTLKIAAELVVAADGRDSALRAAAGLTLDETGPAIDVLWFRVDRPESTPPDTIAYIGRDTVITIPRTEYYQCAAFIPKGAWPEVQRDGLGAFRDRIVRTVPFLGPTIDGVDEWDDVKLLDVRIAHAPRWSIPGLVLIGDAAHPMSPAFGVGINYAVQDAVATARELIADRQRMGDPAVLRRIQERRSRPAQRMQRIQRAIHRTVGRSGRRRLPPRWLLRAVTPVLAVVLPRPVGRLVGAGFRPERIDVDRGDS